MILLRIQTAVITFLVLASACHAQCSTGNECGRGFGAAIPPKPGCYTRQWHCAQINSARPNQTTIYRCDWVGLSAELSPLGRKQIYEFIHQQGFNRGQLLLESSGTPSLDSQRQARLSEHFSWYGWTVDPSSFAIVPLNEFLYGEQAPIISARAFNSGQQDSSFGALPTNRVFNQGIYDGFNR